MTVSVEANKGTTATVKILTENEKLMFVRIAKIKLPDLLRHWILNVVEEGALELKNDLCEFLSDADASLFEVLEVLHQALFWSSHSVADWEADDETVGNEEYPKPLALSPNMRVSEFMDMAWELYCVFNQVR